jgi:hypothetical protein
MVWWCAGLKTLIVGAAAAAIAYVGAVTPIAPRDKDIETDRDAKDDLAHLYVRET